MIEALRVVFRQPVYLAGAAMTFVFTGILYSWSAQVLIVGPRGLSALVEPDVIAAIAVLAFLFAVSLPLQVYAARLALLRAGSGGGTVIGVLVGTASMSCCAPVLLPAILSLIGFSGAAILSVNLAIHRYFVPLALLGGFLLAYSIHSTAMSLAQECVLPAVEATAGPVSAAEGKVRSS